MTERIENKSLWRLVVTGLCMGLFVLATSKSTKAEGLKLIQTTLYAEQGKQYDLKAESSAAVVWESSDAGIASVADGVIRAHKPGYVKITASDPADPAGSAICQVVVRPKMVSGLMQKNAKSDRILLGWTPCKICDGYRIYYRKKGTGEYTLARQIGDPKAAKAKLTHLAAETGYDLRIVSYLDTPLGLVEGSSGQKSVMYTSPDAPRKTKITKVTLGKFSFYRGEKIRFFNVEWKKVKGANAYQVYCTNGKKKPQLLITTKKPKAALYAALDYRYKIYVVACRTKHGHLSSGKKSAAVTIDLGRR